MERESEFPSNSRTEKITIKAEPKKIERVISGEVIRRKKPLSKRFLETFTGGDAKGVWNYVVMDVMLPAAKDMIADAVSSGVERMIFGEGRSSSRRGYSHGNRSSGNNGFVSYNRYSSNTPRDNRHEEPRSSMTRRGRAIHDFDEIILRTRVEAEEVIDQLFELVSMYNEAKVSDLYSMCGIADEYTDGRYGWTDIRGAGVTKVRNGYLLDLPKPELLE